MEIRLLGHSAYYTECHVVWIPKYRYYFLTPGVQAYLVKLFPKVMGIITRVRDSQIQYTIRPYPYGDDHPAEIFG